MIGQIKSSLATGNPRALFAAFLYFDTSFMLWVLLGALANYIAEDLGLSPSEKGLLTAIPILSGAALRLLLGVLADRIGARRIGLAGMVLTAIPLVLGFSARDLPALYFVGALLGIAGASFAVALPLASRWYPPQHQGLVLGIAGAGNSGTVLAFLLAPRLAESMGWNAVFAFALLPLAAVFAVFFLLAKDSPNQPAPIALRDYRAALLQRDGFWFCFFYAVTFGGFVGLGSYLAVLLRDSYGMDKLQAANVAALAVFLGSFARPLGGLIADRVGGTRLLLALFGLIAALMLALTPVPSLALAIALLLATMTALGLGNGAIFQLLPQRFPRQMGSMTGLVGASGGVGGFCLPLLLSLLADRGWLALGFFFFALTAGLALVLLASLHNGWQDWQRAVGAAVRARPGTFTRPLSATVEE